MKTVLIGDIHGRPYWKQIIEQEQDADRFVFVGDYFDSFTISGGDQLNNFLDIIAFKKATDKEVILLLGNHDYHYYPGIDETSTSGYQTLLAFGIKIIVDGHKEHLQVAYQFDDFVCSHAGLSSVWLDDIVEDWDVTNMVDKVNELFKYQPRLIAYRSFKMLNETEWIGAQGYGDESFQGPLWIRPKSLMAANRDTLRTQVRQIVGHTPQDQIDIEGKATGGRYYFIDTLEYGQNQYLVVKDGVVSLGKLDIDNEKTKTT
jgi:UDP-2,3-diacylglucosamine pyrophosphatase LpxH